MTHHELAALRLENLAIAAIPDPLDDKRVESVVSRLGAVQAQDYHGTLWALGLRSGASLAEVERAVEEARIVRTWPMRGTLHFVAAEDLRWMTKLLTPRVIAGTKSRQAALELDPQQFIRSQETMTRVLSGGRVLGREDLLAAVEADGVSTAGGRGYHLLFRAAMESVICVGPTRNKEQTFALLDDWVPASIDRGLAGDEAIIELARRYFKSHGPATAKDFAGWTGLTMAETKRAIANLGDSLASESLEGIEYWWQPQGDSPRWNTPRVDLLPGFDEFLLGYKNRDAVLDPSYADRVCPGNNGMFKPTIVADGMVRGTWKRTVLKNRVQIELSPFVPLGEDSIRLASAAAHAFGRFLGLEAELVV